MEQPPFAKQLTGTVEADETYVGGKQRRSNVKKFAPLDPDEARQAAHGRDSENKTPVLLLVERGGQARSVPLGERYRRIPRRRDPRRHVAKEAHLRTDSYPSYKKVGKEYASHETVDHSIEYVRGDAHTNTAENYFSILKRGIDGVYHHVSEAHLPRYLAEFDFRYNHLSRDGWTDADRTVAALRGVVGKRLTYSM